jgi:hypothetical protein
VSTSTIFTFLTSKKEKVLREGGVRNGGEPFYLWKNKNRNDIGLFFRNPASKKRIE